MKAKVFLIVVLLSVMFRPTLQAQYADYYYHRVGDTIEWKSEIGYYDWWEMEQWYRHYLTIHVDEWMPMYGLGFPDSAMMLQRFYTPVPLKIIGMATASVRGRGFISPRNINPSLLDTDSFKQYLYIYDAMPDSFPLVASVEWSPLDPCRFLHVMGHAPHDQYLDSCCINSPWSNVLRLYEYYYDSAIYVTDSFYVGGSDFSAYDVQETDPLRTTYWAATPAHNSYNVCNPDLQTTNGPVPCLIPDIHTKVKHGERGFPYNDDPPFYQAQWKWIDNPLGQSVMIYPIIEVDTTVPPASACDSVGNIQVTTSGTTATVTWDDFPNYTRVLLRHGKRNEPESQWREEDVTGSTLLTLTGLDPMTFYRVTMKAECEKKDTPWSAPVGFYIASDTSGGGTGGIEGGGTLLSQLTFLQPNPAQDEVQVSSSFSLSEIDIWTADGVMVYHGSATGHEATLDVSWLRTGTYIVAIHTHNGTTHKRLLIAR